MNCSSRPAHSYNWLENVDNFQDTNCWADIFAFFSSCYKFFHPSLPFLFLTRLFLLPLFFGKKRDFLLYSIHSNLQCSLQPIWNFLFFAGFYLFSGFFFFVGTRAFRRNNFHYFPHLFGFGNLWTSDYKIIRQTQWTFNWLQCKLTRNFQSRVFAIHSSWIVTSAFPGYSIIDFFFSSPASGSSRSDFVIFLVSFSSLPFRPRPLPYSASASIVSVSLTSPSVVSRGLFLLHLYLFELSFHLPLQRQSWRDKRRV